MRKLTKKQKVLLMYEYERLIAKGIKNPDYFDADYKTLLDIDNLNPCEVFSQNVDRLFTDLNLAYNIKKTW